MHASRMHGNIRVWHGMLMQGCVFLRFVILSMYRCTFCLCNAAQQTVQLFMADADPASRDVSFRMTENVLSL
jgi:hypothetical protein